MQKVVQFCPKAILLSFSIKGTSVMETLVVPLSKEEINIIKGMDSFRLTRLNYGTRAMILGDQSKYVEVKTIESRLDSDWSTGQVFSEYKEHYFDRTRPNHEFLDMT